MNTQNTTHAIIIGGSMAGLLAARVLSDHFDRVTILERDRVPESAEFRNGVPQARHLHTLLAQGQFLMEGLFPGLTAELNTLGAPQLQWGLNSATMTAGGWVKRFDSGITSNVCSRVSLEWLVRQRVKQIANVTILTEQDVDGMLQENSQIVGVNVMSRRDKSTQTLYANLIVDASGRESKMPEWLQTLGYDAPQETIVNANLGYATRWYRIPENVDFDWMTLTILPNLKKGYTRGAGAFIVEDNEMVITLAGTNEDYPPTEEAAFLAFANSLQSPAIADIIPQLEPITPIYGYRRTANRQRHYERLSRLPENFIVVGDAVCAFNPVYGQGMTVATMEALELDKLLKAYDVRNLKGFAGKFQKTLAKTVKNTWLMATGEDLRYPKTIGTKPSAFDRIVQKYVDQVLFVLPHDDVIALAFMEVMNLMKAPASLLYPRIALRVLRHSLFGHGKAQPTVQPFKFLQARQS